MITTDDIDFGIFMEGSKDDTIRLINLINQAYEITPAKKNLKITTFCHRQLGSQDIAVRLKHGRIPVRRMKVMEQTLNNYIEHSKNND